MEKTWGFSIRARHRESRTNGLTSRTNEKSLAAEIGKASGRLTGRRASQSLFTAGRNASVSGRLFSGGGKSGFFAKRLHDWRKPAVFAVAARTTGQEMEDHR